uniref:Uncharacterized protein n=1 Tax=Trichogramma kaykai TaxID=54128 RepID=A0ABD2XRU0_9HYME
MESSSRVPVRHARCCSLPEDRGRAMRGRFEEENRRKDLERNTWIERDRGRKRQETLEEIYRRRAASTARRVAFASGLSGANVQNSANQVTFSCLDRSLPAAFVTARSEPSQNEMTGRSHEMQKDIGQGFWASRNAMSGMNDVNWSERDVRAQDRRERTFVCENEASEADEMRGRSYSAGAYASRNNELYNANSADLPSARGEMRDEQRSYFGHLVKDCPNKPTCCRCGMETNGEFPMCDTCHTKRKRDREKIRAMLAGSIH